MTASIRFALASVALVSISGLAQAQEYTFRPLGLPGAVDVRVTAVNDSGTVAGRSQLADGTTHAFVQTGANVVDLFPTAYFASPDATPARESINAAGHVIGFVRQTSSDCNRGFLYYGGVARVLSIGGCSWVVSVNRSGQVVGYGDTSDGKRLAFVYTPSGSSGTYVTIELGGSYSIPTGLNDAGQATGYATLSSGRYHAFRFDPGTGATDLGTLGGLYSYGYAVNAAGDVAGIATNEAGQQRMFKYTGGTMSGESLSGTQESSAGRIDDNGWVIGVRRDSSSNERAVRFDGSIAQDVTSMSANDISVNASNSTGTFSGYAYRQTSYYQYCYWDYYYGWYCYYYYYYEYTPFVWHGGTLYTRPTNTSFGYFPVVAENGYAAGYDYASGNIRGLVFDPATSSFQTFGLGSTSNALHVNAAGVAVGWADIGTQRVAVRRTSAGTSDLNTLVALPTGTVLLEASLVSDAGHIAGRFQQTGGCNSVCAYLLTPVPDDDDAPISTAAAEPLPNAAGWANTDVTATITAEDDADGSGVKEIVYTASGAGALAETVVSGATATLVVTAEGETTITYVARDNGGNEEAPKTLIIRIDKTAPTTACGSADGVWHPANVTVDCTAEDLVSGLLNASDASFGLTTSVAADAESADAATDSRTVCDLAGNCASAGPITGHKIDRRLPDVTLGAPAAGTYSLHQIVSADFACGDTGAGLASCTGDLVTGSPIDTATAGAKSFAVTAADAVGNTRTTMVSYTVLKGIPTISWDPPASIAYGTALGSTELDATSSVPGSFVYTPAAGTVLAVGSHPLSATFTPDDAANYESVTTANSVAVTPAALTVTAADATKVYGAAVPSLTAAIDGFVNGDTIASLDGTLAVGTTATSASPVGGYPITPSGLSSPNYTVTFVPATLTVTPAALTIAAAPASKVYGAPIPAFAGLFGGFVNGDDESDLTGTLTFSTAVTAASGVGSYPVTPAGLSSPNYTISFVDGSLAVTPAPLVISADDKSMVLNGSVPALTASYNGLVNGDTPASLDLPASLATAATGSTPGSFPITVANAVDANYTITFTPGTLAVAFAPAGACLAGPGRAMLEPINAAGTSVFKRNATVPAKFRVCDAAGYAVSAAGTIADFRLIQAQSGTVSAINEPVESTTPFTEFRWDGEGQLWVFNMSTKGLAANTTYTFRVSLADGTWLDFRFGLK